MAGVWEVDEQVVFARGGIARLGVEVERHVGRDEDVLVAMHEEQGNARVLGGRDWVDRQQVDAALEVTEDQAGHVERGVAGGALGLEDGEHDVPDVGVCGVGNDGLYLGRKVLEVGGRDDRGTSHRVAVEHDGDVLALGGDQRLDPRDDVEALAPAHGDPAALAVAVGALLDEQQVVALLRVVARIEHALEPVAVPAVEEDHPTAAVGIAAKDVADQLEAVVRLAPQRLVVGAAAQPLPGGVGLLGAVGAEVGDLLGGEPVACDCHARVAGVAQKSAQAGHAGVGVVIGVRATCLGRGTGGSREERACGDGTHPKQDQHADDVDSQDGEADGGGLHWEGRDGRGDGEAHGHEHGGDEM